MNKKIKELMNVVLPHRKINIFILSIMVLGIITGSIFSVLIKEPEKSNIIKSVQALFININKINNWEAFKNSFSINMIFIILMFILGLSIIGIITNIFLVYIKNFILGFSISSFILAYGFKGTLAAFIYIFPQYLINILVIYMLGVYSFIFSIKILYKVFKKNNTSIKLEIKKYIFIFILMIILTIISSLSEGFLLPALIKLVRKLFI